MQKLSTNLRSIFVVEVVFPFIDSVMNDVLLAASADELTHNEKRYIDRLIASATSLAQKNKLDGFPDKNAEWTVYKNAIYVLAGKMTAEVSWLRNRHCHLTLLASVSHAAMPYSELF